MHQLSHKLYFQLLICIMPLLSNEFHKFTVFSLSKAKATHLNLYLYLMALYKLLIHSNVIILSV